MPRPKQAWELTPTAFEKLLREIEGSPALAQGGYPELHARLVRFFEWQACRAPEAAADETVDRATRKIEQGVQATDIGRFIWGIARNVLKEYQKRQSREVSLELIHGDHLQAPGEPDQSFSRCLELCFGRLSSAARSQVWEYVESKDRGSLASLYGLTLSALRNRISRLRDKLRDCANDCMSVGATPSLPVQR